jgi:isopropylmalate/homocitrate/citramalate synthase
LLLTLLAESTLREGEQFANAYFDLEAKIKIARALDEFGVDCTAESRGIYSFGY